MKHHIILVFFCIVSFLSQAQQVEYYYHDEAKEYKCKEGEKFSPDMLRSMIATDTIQDKGLLACCYYRLGFHYRNENPVEAIRLHQIAASLRETDEDKDGLLWKSYGNLAIAHNKIEYYGKALNYADKAFEAGPQFENTPVAYTITCLAYRGIGELNKSIHAGRKAVLIATNTNSGIGEAKEELCLTLRHKNTPESLAEALQIVDEVIAFYQSENNTRGIARTHNHKGQILHQLKQYEKALSSYIVAKEKYQEIEANLDVAFTLNNISITYYEQKKYYKAINLLENALKLKQKYHNNTAYQFDYASTYENLADSYAALKKYEKAIAYYNKSIDNLKDNPTAKTPYIYSKPHLLQVLDLKAQAAFKSGNTDLAHRTYADLDDWINEFYKDLSTNESKLTWIDRAHAMYAHAIEVALEKNDKEKAFQYAEKAHAVLLWQSLSQQAAQSLLSEKDIEIRDDITTQIRQADQQYRDQKISIDKLRELEREREVIEKQFEEKYPEYKKRKYQPEATTVHDIQSKIIDGHTAFIEYYQTDEVLYIFFITKNGLEIIPQNANGLTDDISKFVKNISHKNLDVENYHALAHKLYTQLIPSAIRSNDDIKHLVIVPDREIGTLPFAALATQATSGILNQDSPFLVQKYSTNYLYSAGSYLQLQQKSANQKYCFAGIAPVEYQLERWQKLPNSEDELNEIKTLHWVWDREILIREQATKAEFERIIKEGYSTIQVSTHAVFDENKGRIIFHDGALTQDEIDQLEINTHRLILSACETGVGTQNQGEGILSLGWNFAYKGVPSITMTHWSVSDVATKEIMVEYHENLNEGIHADQALQNAQQNYLKNITLNRQVHPYYWAAFFHTGNVK